MNILFDIGHPAHVHYFKNLIINLKKYGHEITVVARNREIIFELLEYYKIPFISRGKGSNSIIGKLFYMIIADLIIISTAIKSKSKLFISFSSPYAAQSSFFLNKKHISINDTEHTDKIHKLFTYRFSKFILTPKSYLNNLGSKQYRFKNIMEGFYLNDKVFKPDNSIFNDLKIKRNQKFVFIRFVSWDAHHDLGQSGISIDVIKKIINLLLNKNFKVFISSEENIPKSLLNYKINIKPNKIHSVLYYSSLFIGESATMASECAYLGVPAIYVNSLPLMGYLGLAQEFNILKHFKNNKGLIDYVNTLINSDKINEKAKFNSAKMKSDFSDPNQFLKNFINEVY